MTSNVGSSDLKRAARIGFSNKQGTSERADQDEALRTKALNSLRQTFRPEFLNRIDQIVVFHALGKEELYPIVDLMLAQVSKRLQEQNITLEVSDEVRDLLLREGFDEEYGARPLRRTIQTHVDDLLADALLNGDIATGQTIRLTVENNQIAVSVVQPVQA